MKIDFEGGLRLTKLGLHVKKFTKKFLVQKREKKSRKSFRKTWKRC